jgi:hypothetical protein
LYNEFHLAKYTDYNKNCKISLFLKYISNSVLLYSIHYIFHSVKCYINRQLIILFIGNMLRILPMKTEMLDTIDPYYSLTTSVFESNNNFSLCADSSIYCKR